MFDYLEYAKGCCNEADDCITRTGADSWVCAENALGHDIYGDDEDNISYCENSVWQDCDTLDSRCGACDLAVDFEFCTGNECFIDSGETVFPHGEYTDTSELDCCGDDPGEHYINYGTNPNVGVVHTTKACCSEYGNCVDKDNMCVDTWSIGFIGDENSVDDWVASCGHGPSPNPTYQHWIDCDTDQTRCDNCDDEVPAKDIGWIEAGELGVGEYPNDVVIRCCGDDVDEYFLDDGTNQACCDDPLEGLTAGGDCGCNPTQTETSAVCCADSGGIYPGIPYNGDINEMCCGDTAGEFEIPPLWHPELGWGAPLDSLCCDQATDCAHETTCFNDGDVTAITISSGRDIIALCEDRIWYECDLSPDMCGACMASTSSMCVGNDCWINTADHVGLTATLIGEYGDTTADECCGDDFDPDVTMDENYTTYARAADITIDHIYSKCCGVDYPCLDKDGNCAYRGLWGHLSDTFVGNDWVALCGPWPYEPANRNKWMDMDSDLSRCYAQDWDLVANTYEGIWVRPALGGMPTATPFGEYSDGDAFSCCGDDQGEYYIDDNGFQRCCNFVDASINLAGECTGCDVDFAEENEDCCELDFTPQGKYLDPGFWTGDIGGQHCCGNVVTEHHNFFNTFYQTSLPCGDIVDDSCVNGDKNENDGACCDDDLACVYSGDCYDQDDYTDLDGDGLDDGWCEGGKWNDCDSDENRCNAGCGYWVKGGESAAFGEYNDGVALECCEDDSGEFYKTNVALSSEACCALNTACVDGDGNCVPGGAPEICDDGMDNDCDGDIDCDDSDCVGQTGTQSFPTNVSER